MTNIKEGEAMKVNSSKKKKLKGMTLVEIIVSLAVLGVLTTLVVGTANLIDNYTRSANNVNKKVAVQAPIAEAGYTTKAYKIDPTGTDNKIKITINNNIEFEGEGYITVDPSAPVSDDELGGNLGLKFVNSPAYVEPTTTT